MHTYNGEIGLGLLLAKVFIEGPIKKERSSFAFSLRRCNIDALSYLLNKIINNESTRQSYTFYDINFKANFKLSDSNRIFLVFTTGEIIFTGWKTKIN